MTTWTPIAGISSGYRPACSVPETPTDRRTLRRTETPGKSTPPRTRPTESGRVDAPRESIVPARLVSRLNRAGNLQPYQISCETRRAPSTIDASLAQAMLVSTLRPQAEVPNPQSLPAITFSRPTMFA